MNRLTLPVMIVCLAIAVAGPGCGDDAGTTNASSDGAATAGSTETEGAVAPTKAEFIRQGDAICKAMDKTQEADLQAYLKKNPALQSSKADKEQAILDAGLPPIQDEVEELAALTTPAGDEAEVGAIVDGIEEALKQSERDPGSLLDSVAESPFAEVGKLASKYGFKACSNAF